jgi:hypothetical protein
VAYEGVPSMNLMLTFIFVCVLIGLLTPRFGRREMTAIGVVAAAMTSLYLFFSTRFM